MGTVWAGLLGIFVKGGRLVTAPEQWQAKVKEGARSTQKDCAKF